MAPNLLICVMDAARGRSFSAYGHERETTPNVDRLAEDGALFERATPPAPATFDSVTSMLSGTYPEEHQSGRVMRVNARRPMLPAVLSDRGYTTGFATSSPGTTPAFGYGAGIDRFYDVTNKYDGMNVAKFFDETRDLPGWRRYLRFAREAVGPDLLDTLRNAYRFRFGYGGDDGAAEVTAAAEEFVAEADEPWFLYLHYTETHLNKKGEAPYAVPEEHLTTFTGPDPRYDDLGVTGGPVDYSEEQTERHRRLYDGALHYLDAQVGDLVAALRREGAFEDTLLAVTSDHGEALGEGGRLGHGTLDEPVLDIPLVLRGPGVTPGRVEERANLLWLYRTAVEAAGGAPEDLPGADLRGEGVPDEVLCQNFTETWEWSTYGEAAAEGAHALYRDDLKLVDRPDDVSLYDLAADPEATADVSERRAEDLAAMEAALEEFRAGLDAAADDGGADLDAGTEDRLRELGYLE